MNNINGHYIQGNHIAHQIVINFPPVSAAGRGQVLEDIRRAYAIPPFIPEQPSTHTPSHSDIRQNAITRLAGEAYYPSAERSIIEVRVMIEMVRTMMVNPTLCSSANLPETLAALQRVLFLTELAVDAYRHTPLAKSLSRAIAVRVEHCRQLLHELLKNLSNYRHLLSEAVLYFIHRYVFRRLGEAGVARVVDSRLRDCHKSFAACLLALGR